MPAVPCEGGRPYELVRDGGFSFLRAADARAAPDAVRRDRPDLQVARTAAAQRQVLPALVLIRPDGYVAWAVDRRRAAAAEVPAAVEAWCGPGRTDSHVRLTQIRPSPRARSTAS